ncbi:hypothetical protein HZY93_07510 [Streptococcus danieliae]|uniref:Uncharacterized protein n=1 Tax=Streptococcus danieliae TaxID=747656 RepID=A0A7Z0RR95_9STRE|nr:hypothetical protein [Streptococcus danieliae]MBF0717860.1 hypothetical protein [Streptococcus danieliae]NYS49790.1 hypothetical protein [Streptococcus danieliae]
MANFNLKFSNPDYDPIMAMIVDNLDYIPRLEDDSIHYDFDGHSIIHNATYGISVTGSSEEYFLSKNDDLYYFTGQGEFSHHRIFASYPKLTDNSDQRKIEAKKYVAEILEPLIAIQPKLPIYSSKSTGSFTLIGETTLTQ